MSVIWYLPIVNFQCNYRKELAQYYGEKININPKLLVLIFLSVYYWKKKVFTYNTAFNSQSADQSEKYVNPKYSSLFISFGNVQKFNNVISLTFLNLIWHTLKLHR